MEQSDIPNPFQSLIRLILLVIGFTFLAQIAYLLLVFFFKKFTGESIAFNAIMNGTVNEMRLLLVLGSIGSFIIPSWIMQAMEGYRIRYFDTYGNIQPKQLLFVFCAMLSFMPLMGLIGHWNESMQLPDTFRSVQTWMEDSEKQAGDITKAIIMDARWSGLILNLFVLALIPAIGEELLFRGCLQQIFGRWTNNPHLVIWTVAFIFSAIHLQFFGFFPRLFLGVFFGYVYHWSKNILYPIFGHFVNNACATVVAFYYARKGDTYEQMNAFEQQSIFIYLASLVFTVIFVALFYKITQQKSNGKGLEKN